MAKAVNGKRTPNSGATPFSKGDVHAGSFCIECKTVTQEQQSVSIKREWIDKLKEEMFAAGKSYWSLVFNFGGLRNKENFYIIDERLFKQLQQIIEEDII